MPSDFSPWLVQLACIIYTHILLIFYIHSYSFYYNTYLKQKSPFFRGPINKIHWLPNILASILEHLHTQGFQLESFIYSIQSVLLLCELESNFKTRVTNFASKAVTEFLCSEVCGLEIHCFWSLSHFSSGISVFPFISLDLIRTHNRVSI